MNRDFILSTISRVIPIHVCNYLQRNGWIEKTNIKRKDIFLFQRSNDDRRQVIIPRDNDYEQYPENLLSSIEQIRSIEGGDNDSLLTRLCHPTSDILRYRVRSPQAESGTLTLGTIDRFVSSVVASLKVSVCDVRNPTRHHVRIGNKEVDKLLDGANFGQTEHGSFVVKIIIPDPLEPDVASGTRSTVLRQGITHLLGGTNSLIRMIKSGGVIDLLNGMNTPLPFSDNFVNVIAEMQVLDDADVEISAEWSLLGHEPDGIPSNVKIASQYFKEIEMVGQMIAPKPEERQTEFFTGFVTQLDGNPNDYGKQEGDVSIFISTSEENRLTVRAHLNADEYRIAINAHEHNVPVTFSGKIFRKSPRKREVIEISDFSICPSANPVLKQTFLSV